MFSDRTRDSILLGLLFGTLGQPWSRAALMHRAGIPERYVESALAPYIKAGYPIAFHPDGRVSLDEPPDIWCAEEIEGRCPQQKGLPAWRPLLLAETASTNDVAREQGRRGAAEGFLVAASRQTAGRGRQGRHWESPPDRGLYVSLLLRPDLTTADVGRLPILSSVAAADAVEALAGRRPQVKWPNDLLLGGKKLAGLLIETEHRAGKLDFAVVGIGINVRQSEFEFSPEVRGLATSLHLVTGNLYRRADLLVALLHAFEHRLSQPFAEVREAWKASSLTLGQQVTLATARGRLDGQAIGLDDSGALLLRTASGAIETVTAGDMQTY